MELTGEQRGGTAPAGGHSQAERFKIVHGLLAELVNAGLLKRVDLRVTEAQLKHLFKEGIVDGGAKIREVVHHGWTQPLKDKISAPELTKVAFCGLRSL